MDKTSSVDQTIRPYGPGKFEAVMDAAVWDMALDGCDAECGDSGIGIWYGRLDGPFDITALDLTSAERLLITSSAGIILSEDGNGFVTADYIETVGELDAAWARCESDAAKYENADDENEG
jgi:hypothetical protein